MEQPRRFQIVTWNIGRRRASVLDALARLCRPDILTLQEVRVEHLDAYRERLTAMGLPHADYSGNPGARTKRYGNVIASRWPLQPVQFRTRRELPFRQSLAHAAIAVDGRSIVVVTAHIPNGSGNGWKKIDTFRVLKDLVQEVKGAPCIVTGDFNEPQFAIQDGCIVTWGQERTRSGRFVCWDRWKFHGRSSTGREWDDAVRWFFEKQDDHGLRLAFWDASGRCARAKTHVSRGNPRWFDHMFVSADFRVESCSYLHRVRRPGVSDHSALSARLAFADG